jgi:hypothetical protein
MVAPPSGVCSRDAQVSGSTGLAFAELGLDLDMFASRGGSGGPIALLPPLRKALKQQTLKAGPMAKGGRAGRWPQTVLEMGTPSPSNQGGRYRSGVPDLGRREGARGERCRVISLQGPRDQRRGTVGLGGYKEVDL